VIAAVRGTVAARDGDLVTIATPSGVSYRVAVPLDVLGRLPRTGTEVHLHTVLVVREDSWSLFGFDAPNEKAVFQRLLGATGVGPRLALSLISALGGGRVVRAVMENDIAALCTVSGVGKKKAERLVLELKDRMRDLEMEAGVSTIGSVGEQSVAALINLGYGQLESADAVRAVSASNETAPLDEVIRNALTLLSVGK
jgi:Holliday junction DNA helicase RuvA